MCKYHKMDMLDVDILTGGWILFTKFSEALAIDLLFEREKEIQLHAIVTLSYVYRNKYSDLFCSAHN